MSMPAIAAAAMMVSQQNNAGLSNAPEWMVILYISLLALLLIYLIYVIYITIKY